MKVRVLAIIFIGILGILGVQASQGVPQAYAQSYLEKNGYTNVAITGMKWFKCPSYRIIGLPVGFTASINGKEVSGVACFRSIVSDNSIPMIDFDSIK